MLILKSGKKQLQNFQAESARMEKKPDTLQHGVSGKKQAVSPDLKQHQDRAETLLLNSYLQLFWKIRRRLCSPDFQMPDMFSTWKHSVLHSASASVTFCAWCTRASLRLWTAPRWSQTKMWSIWSSSSRNPSYSVTTSTTSARIWEMIWQWTQWTPRHSFQVEKSVVFMATVKSGWTGVQEERTGRNELAETQALP